LQPLDAERVKLWRHRRMLSQQEVADRAGTSLFTIQRIERGEGNVRPKTGRGVAAALGVEIEELLPKAQSPLPLDYEPTEPQRAHTEQFSELDQTGRAAFKVALEHATEDVERRANAYHYWLDFVTRYADRWEQRIETGNFDMGNVNEFIATLGDLLPVLHALNADEQRELPPQDFSFGLPGAKTGQAIGRLSDLLDPMLQAGVAKFKNSDLAPLRQKHADLQKAAHGDGIRRGA
jgi:transcriptional regulator with XRE-family HTH domain